MLPTGWLSSVLQHILQIKGYGKYQRTSVRCHHQCKHQPGCNTTQHGNILSKEHTFLCFSSRFPSGPNTEQVLYKFPWSSSGIDPETNTYHKINSCSIYSVKASTSLHQLSCPTSDEEDFVLLGCLRQNLCGFPWNLLSILTEESSPIRRVKTLLKR